MAHRTEDHSDLKLFKNRLWKLMEGKQIYTAKEMAKILYSNGLVTVKQKRSYDDPRKIHNNAIDTVEKKIQKHLNANTANELQAEYVIAYCNFFGCSSDYLFGFIVCKTHDKQFINNYTGLSSTSIDRLHSHFAKLWLAPILNMLIPMNTFEYTLFHISEYIKNLSRLKEIEPHYNNELKRYESENDGNYNGESALEKEYHSLKDEVDRQEFQTNKWFLRTLSLITEHIEKVPEALKRTDTF